MNGVDPEIVSLIRAISLVLFCIGGIAPSAIQILRSNRK